MRRLLAAFVVVAILGTAAPSQAFVLVVFDAVAWAKHYATRLLHDEINDVQQKINEGIYIVNRRLSSWIDVAHYALTRGETPPWKIFDWFNTEAVFFARDMHHTLSYGGNPDGHGWASIALPRTDPSAVLGGEDGASPEAIAYLRAQLASIDLADAVIVRSADASGLLRYAGRAEDQALTDLQGEVLLDDQEQAMNAVLSKLTAQSLIEARNAQSALTLQTALVELLAIDGKRDRDAQTAALNGQITALHPRETSSLDGTAAILSHWKSR